MRVNGNLELEGVIKGLKIETLDENLSVETAGNAPRLWVFGGKLHYFNGVDQITILDVPTGGVDNSEQITALEQRLENGFHTHNQEEAAAEISVTHNLGNKYPQVQVVDANDEMIVPDSVTFVDENSLIVTLTTAAVCKVIVQGLKVTSSGE